MAVDAHAAARMLRQRAQRARAAREGRAAEALRQVQALVPALLPKGGRAWLIGSLAWGGFGERSDIDLVTHGVNGLDTTQIEAALTRSVGVGADAGSIARLSRLLSEGNLDSSALAERAAEIASLMSRWQHDKGLHVPN